MTFTVLFSTPPSKEHRQKCGLWDSLCCFLNVDKGSAAHLHFWKETHLEQEPQPASGSSGGTFGILQLCHWITSGHLQAQHLQLWGPACPAGGHMGRPLC